MSERDLLEAERLPRHRRSREKIFPEDRAPRERSALVRVQVGHADDVLERGQLAQDSLELLPPVEGLGSVLIAVHTEQEPRRKLREAVEHTARAELRAAARPDRSDARGREHGDERL